MQHKFKILLIISIFSGWNLHLNAAPKQNQPSPNEMEKAFKVLPKDLKRSAQLIAKDEKRYRMLQQRIKSLEKEIKEYQRKKKHPTLIDIKKSELFRLKNESEALRKKLEKEGVIWSERTKNILKIAGVTAGAALLGYLIYRANNVGAGEALKEIANEVNKPTESAATPTTAQTASPESTDLNTPQQQLGAPVSTQPAEQSAKIVEETPPIKPVAHVIDPGEQEFVREIQAAEEAKKQKWIDSKIKSNPRADHEWHIKNLKRDAEKQILAIESSAATSDQEKAAQVAEVIAQRDRFIGGTLQELESYRNQLSESYERDYSPAAIEARKIREAEWAAQVEAARKVQEASARTSPEEQQPSEKTSDKTQKEAAPAVTTSTAPQTDPYASTKKYIADTKEHWRQVAAREIENILHHEEHLKRSPKEKAAAIKNREKVRDSRLATLDEDLERIKEWEKR